MRRFVNILICCATLMLARAEDSQSGADLVALESYLSSDKLSIDFNSFVTRAEGQSLQPSDVIKKIVMGEFAPDLISSGHLVIEKSGVFQLEFTPTINGMEIDQIKAWSFSKTEAFVFDRRGERTYDKFETAFFSAQPPGGPALNAVFKLFFSDASESKIARELLFLPGDLVAAKSTDSVSESYFVLTKEGILKYVVNLPIPQPDLLAQVEKSGKKLSDEQKEKVRQIQLNYDRVPKQISVLEVKSSGR